MGFNQNQLATDLQETFESQPPDAETAAALMAGNIVSNYTDSGGGTPGAWTVLPLASGWVADSTEATPMYRLNGDTVELKGIAHRESGTTILVFGTLPSGFRPPYTVHKLACRQASRGGAWTSGLLSIDTDGSLSVLMSNYYSCDMSGINFCIN